MTADHRLSRVLRGALAAVVALFAAALGHTAAGGGFPGALGLLLAFMLALPACVWLAARGVSCWRLALGVSITQVLFHLFFTIRAGTDSLGVATVPGHGAHTVVTSVGAAHGPHAHSLVAAGPDMWIGHAVAAVVTVAFLYSGERAVWSLCMQVWEWMLPDLPRLTPTVIPRTAPHLDAVALVRPLAHRPLVVAPRRGPPASVNTLPLRPAAL